MTFRNIVRSVVFSIITPFIGVLIAKVGASRSPDFKNDLVLWGLAEPVSATDSPLIIFGTFPPAVMTWLSLLTWLSWSVVAGTLLFILLTVFSVQDEANMASTAGYSEFGGYTTPPVQQAQPGATGLAPGLNPENQFPQSLIPPGGFPPNPRPF